MPKKSYHDGERGIDMRKVITGNEALAYGSKIARAEVIAAYPITPQTTVVEKIADFMADGEMKAKYIKVESEHSAMAACIAASNAGARTFTATSAHGLTLMHELLFWASGARLPIVMGNINRAMGPPWSVWADHLDSIAQRDTGWMQFYCENNQEVLDTVIQAYKICEDKDIMLPAFINEDAFYLSHTSELVDIPDQERVDEFLPQYDPALKLDIDNPMGFGSLVMPEWYMEFRYKIAEAMDRSRKKIQQVNKEFNKMFGRSYEMLDLYRCEDAEAVFIAVGTMASTAKEVVDMMRKEGKDVGVARLRVFRPFPVDEIRELAKTVDFIGVMDRSYSFGYGGAIFSEIKAALYNSNHKPIVKDYIVGLGGKDVTPKVLEKIFTDGLKVRTKGLKDKEIEWIGVKGLGGW
jgi:2-oxoisovalerate ferredoxin oxidoreductase alpha subunit